MDPIPLTTFPFFPLLPPELRAKIYFHALPPLRPHPTPNTPPYFFPPYAHSTISSPPTGILTARLSTLLSVSAEARAEVLRHLSWECIFDVQKGETFKDRVRRRGRAWEMKRCVISEQVLEEVFGHETVVRRGRLAFVRELRMGEGTEKLFGGPGECLVDVASVRLFGGFEEWTLVRHFQGCQYWEGGTKKDEYHEKDSQNDETDGKQCMKSEKRYKTRIEVETGKQGEDLELLFADKPAGRQKMGERVWTQLEQDWGVMVTVFDAAANEGGWRRPRFRMAVLVVGGERCCGMTERERNLFKRGGW